METEGALSAVLPPCLVCAHSHGKGGGGGLDINSTRRNGEIVEKLVLLQGAGAVSNQQDHISCATSTEHGARITGRCASANAM